MAKVKLELTEQTLQEYFDLGIQIKKMEKRRKEMRDPIYDHVMATGHTDISTGSKDIEIGEFTAKLTARVSVSIDDDKALALVKERGLWDRCKTEILDPTKLEALVKDGSLALDDLNNISNKSVNYALTVDRN